MGTRVWGTGILILVVLLWGSLISAADPMRLSSSRALCPTESVLDSIFGFRNRLCLVDDEAEIFDFIGVVEGDEISLQRAMSIAHKNSYKYVVVLFYATWCPFSRTFRPIFSVMSALYSSIPHFAIEESAIRPSTLSKYGVHGFPTIFILNSTMRIRYIGPRTLGSFVTFYRDVTGAKTKWRDLTSQDLEIRPSKKSIHNTEQENCPFPWAKSPENILQQETYLTLATAFVILRLLYLFFPTLSTYARNAWRRHIQNIRFRSLWEHPFAYMKRAIQLSSSLKEPCKRSNLQEGALNAKAWASKSLATVSIGDASTSRGMTLS